MARQTVPHFLSSWTDRMVSHIKAAKWTEQDVLDSWALVCHSWGDKSKFSTVLLVALKLDLSLKTYIQVTKITADWVAEKH